MAFKTQQELQDYTEWAKSEMRGMVDHVRNSDLFTDEVMGHAVWTLPHEVFIGKAWSKSDSNKCFWIISGRQLPTDHIEFKLADTARDAARHFCMKWQMQGARLEQLGESGIEGEPSDGIDWSKVATSLQSQAEALYMLVENDDAWKQTEGPLVGPDTSAVT